MTKSKRLKNRYFAYRKPDPTHIWRFVKGSRSSEIIHTVHSSAYADGHEPKWVEDGYTPESFLGSDTWELTWNMVQKLLHNPGQVAEGFTPAEQIEEKEKENEAR